MRFLGSCVSLTIVAFFISGCSGSQAPSYVPPAPAAAAVAAPAGQRAPESARALAITPVCPVGNVPGVATCSSLLRTDITPNPSSLVSLLSLPGLHPSDLTAAYGITNASTAGSGQTVGVVVAFDNPLLALDLAVYRAEFGLPPCTVVSGCLRLVSASPLNVNLSPAWEAESDLDVEMVSAICPNCKIVVAEAASDQISDLVAAVGTAVASGATVVSNSYSVPEDPSLLAYEPVFRDRGVPMTAGAGDDGFGTGYPASSRWVTAVGGTTLDVTNGAFVGERVWNATGSGCSTIVRKPDWQTDRGCAMRTMNDVAVVGDPATGVAAFMTGLGGWNVLGGTSVGAPIVAGMYALAGNGASLHSGARHLYSHRAEFHNVDGRTAASCDPLYLCVASDRYNGPAGLGTPFGLGAF